MSSTHNPTASSQSFMNITNRNWDKLSSFQPKSQVLNQNQPVFHKTPNYNHYETFDSTPTKPANLQGRKIPSPEEFVKISSTHRWNSSVPTKEFKPQTLEVTTVPTTSPQILSGPTNIEEELTTQNLYKTELCRSFQETGNCRYGTKCQFAHGLSELRPVMRHPKYKTEVCKTFQTIGTCPYGKRCRFIHVPPTHQISNNQVFTKGAFIDEPFNSTNPNETPSLPVVSAFHVSPISALTVPSLVPSKPHTPPTETKPKTDRINTDDDNIPFQDDVVQDDDDDQKEFEDLNSSLFGTSAAFNYPYWGLNLQQVRGIAPSSDAFSTWSGIGKGGSLTGLSTLFTEPVHVSSFEPGCPNYPSERRLAIFQQICCAENATV
eukprot:TRINITY_DN16269_c0_g1_i1.p1 TRINITY_DN16269_c0_g1~~TRINITY_DN16269_c0_g1_i1.p1  ORF type:complete len:389 (-),score=71.15 TRINITY_DN16269_c0_g1_i1:72-1202(-)